MPSVRMAMSFPGTWPRHVQVARASSSRRRMRLSTPIRARPVWAGRRSRRCRVPGRRTRTPTPARLPLCRGRAARPARPAASIPTSSPAAPPGERARRPHRSKMPAASGISSPAATATSPSPALRGASPTGRLGRSWRRPCISSDRPFRPSASPARSWWRTSAPSTVSTRSPGRPAGLWPRARLRRVKAGTRSGTAPTIPVASPPPSGQCCPLPRTWLRR